MKLMNLLIVFVLMIVTSVTVAQQRGPKALVVEPRFNMGYMPQNAKIPHTFWIHNVGTDHLAVRDIRVTCGCTKTDNPTGMVAVNDSVPVEVVFDIGTRRKAQDKKVYVTTNQPINSTLELSFYGYVYTDGEVVGPVTITKNQQLNLTTDDLGKTFNVTFQNNSAQALLPKLVQFPPDLVTIELPAAPVQPGETGTIKVKLAGSVKEKNQLKAFTVEFNDDSKSRYTIPVRLAESISSIKAGATKGS